MPSGALTALDRGVLEVRVLASADPTRAGRLPANPDMSRAVGRACVVLLTGHFEGYLSSVNEEAVSHLNVLPVPSDVLPEALRVRHSRSPIDIIAGMKWPNRREALERYVREEAWLWTAAATGRLRHERLVEGMTSPMPDDLVKYFQLWDVRDVFTAVTRKPSTRGRFWLGVRDLVDKRHAIAHGDATAEATKQDVVNYLRVVESFCSRADVLLGKQIGKMLGRASAW